MRLFLSKKELKLKKKRTIATVVCIILILGIYWVLTRPHKAEPEIPTVIVEAAAKDDVEIYGEYVGRIRAQQFVEVRARVEGYLEQMLFAEGTYVNKNQVLFVINQEQYRAKADKARAQLKKDEAQDKGVKVRYVGGGLVIDLHIAVTYGVNISAIVKSIVNKVRYTVEEATGFQVAKVNVFVDDMKQ